MSVVHYRYTDKELKELLKTLVIIIDTREKAHTVITEYLRGKEIPYKFQKLNTGDYSAMLPANPELGIIRDTYFDIVVERKNSIDEFAQNTKEDRFENELIRSHGMKFLLVIEDSYENLIKGNYRSKYDPKALLGRLKSFEAKYNFATVFMEKKWMGNYVYHHLYYQVRDFLKGK